MPSKGRPYIPVDPKTNLTLRRGGVLPPLPSTPSGAAVIFWPAAADFEVAAAARKKFGLFRQFDLDLGEREGGRESLIIPDQG